MLLYSPCFACIISLKPAACSVRIAMILRRYIECVTSHNRKNCFGSCCEGVASEGRVVGVPNFHSLGKSTMPLANINSDWMSNTSSGLCIIYYVGPLFHILGCNFSDYPSSFLPQVLLPNPVVVPVRVPPLLNPVRVVPIQEKDPPPTPAPRMLLPLVGMHTVSYILYIT